MSENIYDFSAAKSVEFWNFQRRESQLAKEGKRFQFARMPMIESSSISARLALGTETIS
jgi:hypothetical protein